MTPWVLKLQKPKQDIYKANERTDNVISELRGFRDNVDIEFEHCFNLAVKLGEEINTPVYFQD